MAINRINPICGNDAMFNENKANSEIDQAFELEQEYIRQNPYYVNNKSGYQSIYKVDDAIVVTGSAVEENFVLCDINTNYVEYTRVKPIYELYYTSHLGCEVKRNF